MLCTNLVITIKEKYDNFNTTVKVDNLCKLIAGDVSKGEGNRFFNDIDGVRDRDIMVGRRLSEMNEIATLAVRLLENENQISDKQFRYICLNTLISLSPLADDISNDIFSRSDVVVTINTGYVESPRKADCLAALYLMQLLGYLSG